MARAITKGVSYAQCTDCGARFSPLDDGAEIYPEPKWAIGRHDWRSGPYCIICDLHRKFTLPCDDPKTEGGYIYCVNNEWGPAPTPCTQRLMEPFPGFYTTKEACVRIGITPSVFTTRVQQRRIRPAALTPNNGYYWREDQFAAIARAND